MRTQPKIHPEGLVTYKFQPYLDVLQIDCQTVFDLLTSCLPCQLNRMLLN